MKKIMLIAVLVGLMGCGIVHQNGEYNKITKIELGNNTYRYTIEGCNDNTEHNILWIVDYDLGLKVGDLVTITKVEEVE